MIKAYIYLERVQIPFSKFSHRKLKTRNWEWILEEHKTKKENQKNLFFLQNKKIVPHQHVLSTETQDLNQTSNSNLVTKII